ncbi:MAG: hypothetical protein AAFR44_06615 [Pseudomonadota bacterium]
MTRLIFSYGMLKSGSTLAFHYTSALLDAAGPVQPDLPAEALGAPRRINYVDDVSPGQLGRLWLEAQRLGHPLVLKTHQRPGPAVLPLLRDGRASAHACWRDPRDMALSLMDHGARARARGQIPFSEIGTLDDALSSILGQIAAFDAWQDAGALTLDYADIAFDAETTLDRLAAHHSVSRAPIDVAALKQDRFTQFNKGVPCRHRTEMSPEDAARIAAACPAWMTDPLARPTQSGTRPEIKRGTAP